MINFNDFKIAVQKQFTEMAKGELFVTNVDKDTLWETYLNSFPEGTNPIFRERTEHDCQYCKQFIRVCGNVVSVVDNKLVSIWDIETNEEAYQVVADALSELVKSQSINNIFLHYEKTLGTNFNNQLLENGELIKWNHFYFELPNQFVKRGDTIGPLLSEMRSCKDVFKRGLSEITLDSAETVLELIEQNSLYRGAEHKGAIDLFLIHKKAFDLLTNEEGQDNYCWINSVAIGSTARIRNTAIGTLLVDISDGKDLDEAVRLFESKVAPTNYKRPSAVITKSMIANAQKMVGELGIKDSLQRRYATVEDITINNILFADRTTKGEMDIFDELTKEAPTKVKDLKKVEEVSISTFIDTILPKADSIEVMFENSHINNLMSLIAPQNPDAPPIFKWGNNFSWAYNGEVADSIKERVKKAGGNVNGVLRCSLSWFNYDDLDIHVREPNGNHIYYGNSGQRHRSSGVLDVDMNVQSDGSRNAVENIVWTNKSKMVEGEYEIFINNYTQRESIDVGFDVEIEYNGVIHTFHYGKRVVGNIGVAKFEFSKESGIKFIKSLPSTQASKEIWGISTHQFQKVSCVMRSPNHWDGEKTGNLHWFFILEGCKNGKESRGFFNEFLKEDLRDHRKVFEVLGSKMKTAESNNQLSGVGFSSTQRNSIFCRVGGSFTRIIKINF